MRSITTDDLWPGCHGVRIHGDAIDVGWSTGSALLDATVRVGPVPPCDSDVVWTQHGEVRTVNETLTLDRHMRRRPSGEFVITSSRGPSLEVNVDSLTITVEEGDHAAQRQMVASFGIAVLVQNTTNALVLHGSAATRGDRGVVVCGESGTGKSSLLVALIDDGWTPITEDMGVITSRGRIAEMWPGPPWVRLHRGQAGPRGAAVAFDGIDKTAWTASPPRQPVPLTHLVVLQPPGGDAPTIESVNPGQMVGMTLPSAVWLVDDPSTRVRGAFGPLASFTSRVTPLRLRMPRRDTWAQDAVRLLGAL